MPSVTIDDIIAARQRIAGGIYVSPCPESIPLSCLCGAHIYCKLDYLQRTGSFKERGAQCASPFERGGAAAGSDCGIGRESCAGSGVSRAIAGREGDGRDAAICAAGESDHVPQVRCEGHLGG